MTTYFFMGRNERNKSGVSWKVWKIQRSGRVVTVWFGPATLLKRRVVAKGTLYERKWTFRTEEQAKVNRDIRIQEKLREGYESNPRGADSVGHESRLHMKSRAKSVIKVAPWGGSGVARSRSRSR